MTYHNIFGNMLVFANTQLIMKTHPLLMWFLEAVKATQARGIYLCDFLRLQRLHENRVCPHASAASKNITKMRCGFAWFSGATNKSASRTKASCDLELPQFVYFFKKNKLICRELYVFLFRRVNVSIQQNQVKYFQMLAKSKKAHHHCPRTNETDHNMDFGLGLFFLKLKCVLRLDDDASVIYFLEKFWEVFFNCQWFRLKPAQKEYNQGML